MKQKTLQGAAKPKKPISSDNLKRPDLTPSEQVNLAGLLRWMRRGK
jgi:hypothetical protein